MVLVHCCVVIGSVRYQHWLLNNELGDTGEIDRDAGLITSSTPLGCCLLLILLLHTQDLHNGVGTGHWTVTDIVIYLLGIEATRLFRYYHH